MAVPREPFSGANKKLLAFLGWRDELRGSGFLFRIPLLIAIELILESTMMDFSVLELFLS